MLRGIERLALVPYRLPGEKGETIGYGRFYPDSGPVRAPRSITPGMAELMFAEDVEQRAAKWVRLYVTRALTQYQFDALVHMAYNLSPGAFKTIAEAVNRGEDPEAQAMRYLGTDPKVRQGVINRRNAELNLFRNGVYA